MLLLSLFSACIGGGEQSDSDLPSLLDALEPVQQWLQHPAQGSPLQLYRVRGHAADVALDSGWT